MIRLWFVMHVCQLVFFFFVIFFILGYMVLVLWDFGVILHMIVYRYHVLYGTDYILVRKHFAMVSPTWAFILLAGDSVLGGQVEAERFQWIQVNRTSAARQCWARFEDFSSCLLLSGALLQQAHFCCCSISLLFPEKHEATESSLLRHWCKNINYCGAF